MKSKPGKILYCYVGMRSFIKTDLMQLKDHFDVKPYKFISTPKYRIPLSFVVQGLFLIMNGWKYSSFVCFFAGYHCVLPALFAKLTNKSCIIFLGGTDCFNYPSFNYGNHTKYWYGRATCIAAHNASLLVPVSSNLVKSVSNYYTIDSTVQGIYHWCQPLETPYRVIALEYNPIIFSRQNVQRMEHSFVTVAFGIEGSSFIRKGIDKMIMAAKFFPQYLFTIIGCDKKDFPVPIPENISLIPPVPYEQLPIHYSRHQFYLQLSIAEGFPSAICEAMLCECIPIGSEVGAIPEIIGDHGFIVKERKDKEIIDVIKSAMEFSEKEKMGKNGRLHIIKNFGPGHRISELKALFSTHL